MGMGHFHLLKCGEMIFLSQGETRLTEIIMGMVIYISSQSQWILWLIGSSNKQQNVPCNNKIIFKTYNFKVI